MKDIARNLESFFSDRDGVEFAYLFGSQVSGSVSPLSDVDVAVSFRESLSSDARFKAKLELINDLSSLLECEKIDVVDLDEADLLLKYNITRDGVVVKDSAVRSRAEYGIMDEFLDRRYYDVLHASRFLERTARGGLS